MASTTRQLCLLLNRVPGLSSIHLTKLRAAFDSLDRLAHASAEAFQRAAGIAPAMAQAIVHGLRDEAGLQRELDMARCHAVTILTLEDAGYPSALKTIPDPPLALYVRGALEAADAIALAVVGSRSASLYGLRCAEQLAYDAALRGITIVSGLARGIDGAAHRGALRAGGRTIAVLGCGLVGVYPPEHEELAGEIAAKGGVLSEFPMTVGPQPYHFPRRNRLISGLALGVVVVEAAARSGALITADCALEQGREVFAVPGPMTSVTSQGTHGLLKQGARLVTSIEDIVEELHLTNRPVLARMSPPPPAREGAGLSERHRRLLACVAAKEPTSLEAITAHSQLAMPEVMTGLLELELKQLVRQLPGRRFVRR